MSQLFFPEVCVVGQRFPGLRGSGISPIRPLPNPKAPRGHRPSSRPSTEKNPARTLYKYLQVVCSVLRFFFRIQSDFSDQKATDWDKYLQVVCSVLRFFFRIQSDFSDQKATDWDWDQRFV